ncbi:uncharacterized protein LOC130613711 isoform X2 [Hydractinia symbiolongicarpus]|uniref:uncharacterized protein LOC130613711 isoform X2 n=1 Tax=Hydractinia symbiolongicarpus TaxID=13093 RepID=UPI00254A2527|nr:uncharacterized protein LOC130613711 isoform X2 [Hydractinia symbiolongicarpus]XP_057291026.1 uncharacterized protein LOC130613711 isoform X2 [Hydractinia symbiolongicarpus]XP_057291027.1 uncharacterized protein LOC130613711 isoform X2 [Hydractinia symbiolongicarpus]
MHVVFVKAEELVCAITFKRYRESAKKDLPCKYSETEVLKEPYMIIRDRENLFKPLIYTTKIPNLYFEKGCLFEIDKEITRHDSCDTRHLNSSHLN